MPTPEMNNIPEMFDDYLAQSQSLDLQEQIEGQERFNPAFFARKFTVFKLQHFSDRIVDLSDPKIQMPTGSVMHLLDDLVYPADMHSDLPRLELYPLIAREQFMKFIYHVTKFNNLDPVKVEDKYILKFAGLPSALMHFRAEQGNKFKYCFAYKDLPAKRQDCLILINHNPIFRLKLFGRMRTFRRTQLLLSSVLNTVIDVTRETNKDQYVFIPWTDEVFDRPLFVRTREVLNIGTMRKPESIQYLLQMHILNFVHPKGVTSIFNQIPDELLDKINLVLFTANGKYVFYNLRMLKNFRENATITIRVCNQLNTLAVMGRITDESSDEEKKLVEDHIKSIKMGLGDNPGVNNTENSEDSDDFATVTESTISDELKDNEKSNLDPEASVPNVRDNKIVEVAQSDDELATDIEKTKIHSALTREEKEEGVLSHLARKIMPHLTSASTVKGFTPAKSVSSEHTTEVGTIDTQTSVKNVDAKTESSTSEFNRESDDKAVEFLKDRDDLTPKQKERYAQMSKAYKKLELNGQKFEKILGSEHDISIDTSPLPDSVVGDVPTDPSIRNCMLRDYDKSFIRKTYPKQLAGVLSSFRRVGIYLTDIKSERVQTPLNNDIIYTCKYTDIKGKSSTVKLKLPVIDDEGRIFVDGIYKVMKKQRIDLPIVKISDTEVSLSSNYNKYRVIRNTAKAHDYFTYIDSMLSNGRANVNIIYGNNTDIEEAISYDYCAVAARYSEVRWITSDTREEVNLYFAYKDRMKASNISEAKFIALEKEYGIYFGTFGDRLLFVDKKNKVYAVKASGAEDVNFSHNSITEVFRTALLPDAKFNKQLTEWTVMKILDATLPLMFILSYRFGLLKTLDHLHAKYTITERRAKTILGANEASNGTESFGAGMDVVAGGDEFANTEWIVVPGKEGEVAGTEAIDEVKYIPKPGDIAIKFADRTLWFNRYPLSKSLILAGLDNFDVSDYPMADFEGKEVYYKLLMDAGKSMNYIKGIDSFFDLFMDPITFNVLKAMHEPTTPRDLLIRATELLTTTDHRQASSNLNHRIRGYEQFTALVYNELSRQVANYQSARGANNSLSVNPEAVYLRIVTNASLIPSTAVNPLQSIKEASELTHAGSGGRTEESFVVNDRKFTKDDIGVMAVDTVDNGKVGMSAILTVNSGILNTEGLTKPKPLKDLEPSDVLSIHSLTFPFALCDDTKRMNFLAHQSTHMLPTLTVDRWRVRTGYERTIAQYAGRDYSGVAEQDGVVESIDENLKICKVKYKDGTTDIFSYGTKYTDHESVEIAQQFKLMVKKGQKLKKGDIVYYNEHFFYEDPKDNQVDFSVGLKANVALIEMDVDLEDASEISQRLAEKLSINPANQRVVSLPRSALIHMCKAIGDEVNASDPLVIFEEGAEGENSASELFTKASDETLALMSEINRKTPNAKFAGKIVKIEAYYGGPISEMNPTLQPIVRKAAAEQNKLHKAAEGTERQNDFPPSEPLPKYSKFKGVDFDESTVMLIFYIEETNKAVLGDKIVFCNQLKNTISNISSHPRYTEDGKEVDAVFSCESVLRRIVVSPILMGVSSQIMEKVEQNALELYFGKNK